MSQESQIYVHLCDKGPLTPLLAFQLYGTLALHSRIACLRERGIDIECRMIRVGKKMVGEYSLPMRFPYG